MSGSFVIPGQMLSVPEGFLRGHGTFMSEDGHLHSSVSGVVERVNKLVSVQPFKVRLLVFSHNNANPFRSLDMGAMWAM